jgi:hypothetical protein
MGRRNSGEQDAVSFARVVAQAIARDRNQPTPDVTVFGPTGAAVEAKDLSPTCARCHSAQSLSGIENSSDGMCVTFVCTDCRVVATRTVSQLRGH